MRPSKLHAIAIVLAAVALGRAAIVTDAVAAGGHVAGVLSLAIASVAALPPVDSSIGVAGITHSGSMTVTAITALSAITGVRRSMLMAVRNENGASAQPIAMTSRRHSTALP
jgi:hypothetical protein